MDWNPITIDEQRLDYKKIVIQDIIADLKSNFLPMEKKRGFKEHSYYKFVLRDSKLACFINKYSRRVRDDFKNVKRGERITLVGRLERAGKGMRRLVNPKFLFKVDEIREGWDPGEGEAVFEPLSGEEQVVYRDIDPGELSGRPEDYEGEYVRFRESFPSFPPITPTSRRTLICPTTLP